MFQKSKNPSFGKRQRTDIFPRYHLCSDSLLPHINTGLCSASSRKITSYRLSFKNKLPSNLQNTLSLKPSSLRISFSDVASTTIFSLVLQLSANLFYSSCSSLNIYFFSDCQALNLTQSQYKYFILKLKKVNRNFPPTMCYYIS